jgi:hypothetical protein
MDRFAVAAGRLAALGLTGPPAAGPGEVVDRLVAVQAQDHPLAARWSVGQRCGATEGAVAALYDAGGLIRTHVLRPTWHFVRPADLRWIQALTGPRVQVGLHSGLRRLGVSDADRDRSVDVVADALRGGRHLTADELAAALADGGVTVDRLGLSHLLIHAEVEAVICSGPMRGRKATYALVDERIPPAPAKSRRDALTELMVRYFTGHGPASARDFAWWSSLTLADIRGALGELSGTLRSFEVDGTTFWAAPDAPDPTPAPALLLQTFDEYVVGYRDTRAVLDVTGRAGMTGSEWGRAGHPVVVGSQVVGHWKTAPGAGTVTVSVALRSSLDPPGLAALADAAAAYGRFTGRQGVLTTSGSRRSARDPR